MPITPSRELKIGKIIDETLGVLERCVLPGLVYLVVMTALNVPATRYGLDHQSAGSQAVLSLFSLFVGIVGGYFLTEAMLRQTGHRLPGAGEAFLPYVGLSILSILGTIVGFVLLILPGLIVMARWSVAAPLLLSRGEGPVQALKSSWERTRGNEFTIIVAALALAAAFIAIAIFAGVFYEDDDMVGMIVSQLASTAIGVVLTGMGVALFGLLVEREPPAELPA